MSVRGVLAAALTGATLLAGGGAASAPRPVSAYLGQWVFQVGERNLFVLDLKASGGGAALAGGMARPKRLSISQNGELVSGVAPPTVIEPLVTARSTDDGLLLTLADAEDKAQTTEYRMVLDGGDGAQLSIVGAPVTPIPLRRGNGSAAVAADWDPQKVYAVRQEDADDPEMAAIFAADQADRAPGAPPALADLVAKDQQRRLATRGLLEAGRLRSGVDFQRAAFVFQHGDRPDDYLLAHSLALAALVRGHPEANWIAAASLDRFLVSTGRRQIYGTQTQSGAEGQVPQSLDAHLVPDRLRSVLGVVAAPAVTPKP